MSPIGSTLEKKIKKWFWSLAGPRIQSRAPAPLNPDSILSVLALRPDRLGDFILSVPAMKALEERLARGNRGSRLTLVAGERSEELARFLFPKARVLVFRKSIGWRVPLWVRLGFGRYDAVIDFHSYPFSTSSAVLALLAGSPLRVGFWDQGESADLSRNLFNGGGPPPAEFVHEREKSLLLVRRWRTKTGKVGPLISLPPAPARVKVKVDRFFAGLALDPRERVIGIHPTLQKNDNRWQPGHYLNLVKKLAGIPHVKIAVIYGKGEEEELRLFLDKTGPNLRLFPLPENDLLFILEALKGFDLFVGGDSGLTHLASLAAPVLAIFGPSDPRRWGPLGNGFGKPKVLRKKDGLCDSVTVEEVVKEIKKYITAKARRPRRKI